MTVRRCGCGEAVEWLRTGGGRRVPFNHALVPVDAAPAEAWTIVVQARGGVRRAVVVPLSGQGGARVAGIRWVLVRHACPLGDGRSPLSERY